MRRDEVDAGRLRTLVKSFAAARVTVIGDLIVDHYLWGQVQRISPEAPVPVVEVRQENRRLGGAANVAHNIRGLGGRAALVGAIGLDEPGDWLEREAAAVGIDGGGLVRVPGRPTSIKTRVIAHSQQVVRVDRETKDHLPARATAAFKDYLTGHLRPGDTVVVSDYGKGVASGAVLQFLREISPGMRLRVLIDPKSKHFHVYRGFTLVTPNQREAEQASGVEITDTASLRKAGRKLLEVLESKALLVTRGEAGMSLFLGGRLVHLPTSAREVFDVTGAGDTVVATLALGLAAGATLLEAAFLANMAAGIVVGEVGTSVVTDRQILAALKGPRPYVETL